MASAASVSNSSNSSSGGGGGGDGSDAGGVVAAAAKNKSVFKDDGSTKMLFVRSVMADQVHQAGCNITSAVPELVNEFLGNALKYYANHPDASAISASAHKLHLELKPTLVTEFLRPFKLSPARRTAVKQAATAACSVMLETAIDACQNAARKTIDETDLLLAVNVLTKIIKNSQPSCTPQSSGEDSAKQDNMDVSPGLSAKSLATKKPKTSRPKKPKTSSATVAQAISSADGSAAALSGPVPPPSAAAKTSRKRSRKMTVEDDPSTDGVPSVAADS